MKTTRVIPPFILCLLLAAAWILGACMGGSVQSSTMQGGAAAVVTRPAHLDTSTSLTSVQGLFRVSYHSELDPVAINQLHSWTIHVETPNGEPVDGAQVSVSGGMPEHNHGMPTQLQVTRLGKGDYKVEGMKFHMPGWWTVIVQVANGSQQDSATFNLLSK